MIKVLIVDDSAIIREVFTKELSKYPDISVVGTAPNAFIARDKILKLHPDVVTLDIGMPEMDGLTFLKKVMIHYPMSFIIVSSQTPDGSSKAIEALSVGAVDIINKPGVNASCNEIIPLLYEKIKIAAKVNHTNVSRNKPLQVIKHDYKPTPTFASKKIIAFGASTGGTTALEQVLTSLPDNSPPILIVQHMPEKFTMSFANRLNSLCSIEVREAQNGDMVVPGLALIAPGNYHMVLCRNGLQYYVEVKSGPRVYNQRPSVDVLFYSVAKQAGKNAVGVILTGMGGDGAQGLLAMRTNGARTVAQDEESCVVFGMPAEAIKVGAAEQIAPLDKIASLSLALCSDE